MPSDNTVYELGFTEEVECYFCQKEHFNKRNAYKRGEAFLAGAGHSPCNANANYICKEHLDDDAVIEEPIEHFGDRFAIEDAVKKLTETGVDHSQAKSRVLRNYESHRNSGRFISDDDLIR